MSITEKLIDNGRLDMAECPSYVGKTLNIELSSACNERCIYCYYYAQGMHKKGKLIDEELFYRVTKEAYELGVTDVGLYMFGEPLVNPKIYEYVDYLKHKIGFKYVYISTNGILLTPQNLEKLVLAGIDSIKFSISGASRDTFLKHHGVDAYERVCQNIKYAYEYREKNQSQYKLYMFTILTRYNIQEKPDFEEQFSGYVDEMVFVPVNENRNVIGNDEYLSINEKDSLFSSLSPTVPCYMLFNKICVDANGHLLTCCDDFKDNLNVVADLHKMSLKDAVYGEQFVNLRKKHLEHNVSGTICEYCVYGNAKEIKPLCDVYEIGKVDLKPLDMSNEIRSRFNLD